jgi:hypothetical protein
VGRGQGIGGQCLPWAGLRAFQVGGRFAYEGWRGQPEGRASNPMLVPPPAPRLTAPPPPLLAAAT